jgi:hypothetical protein
MIGDHPVKVVVAGHGKLQANPESVQRRVAASESPKRRGDGGEANRIVIVLQRFKPDVVAEPLRLLVGVSVAADVDKQRRVVDDRPCVSVEANPLCQPQGNQTLPEYVLHRLAEPQVYAQGQGRDKLGKPYL